MHFRVDIWGVPYETREKWRNKIWQNLPFHTTYTTCLEGRESFQNVWENALECETVVGQVLYSNPNQFPQIHSWYHFLVPGLGELTRLPLLVMPSFLQKSENYLFWIWKARINWESRAPPSGRLKFYENHNYVNEQECKLLPFSSFIPSAVCLCNLNLQEFSVEARCWQRENGLWIYILFSIQTFLEQLLGGGTHSQRKLKQRKN